MRGGEAPDHSHPPPYPADCPVTPPDLPTPSPRFLAAVWEVTGHRPWQIYGPLWRFGSPGAMVALLGASLSQLALHPPTYQAWDRATVRPQAVTPHQPAS